MHPAILPVGILANPPPEPPLGRRATAALVSAVTVAAIAHVATVLAFFVAGGANTESLSQVSDYFLVATLFAFILLAVVAALDGLRRWYVAVPAAIVVAVIASLLGTVVTLVTSRTPIEAATIGPLLGTLLGPSLVYIVAFTVAAATVGRRIWFALAGTSTTADATGSGRVALVRAPAQNLAEGQVTHIERAPIDTDLAEDQWDGYLQALIDNGWEPMEVTAAPAMPDSVFIEDAVVMFDDTAVITSPGARVAPRRDRGGRGRRARARADRSAASNYREPSTAATCSRSAAPSTWAAAGAPTPKASASCAPSSPRSASPWSRCR